MKRMVMHKKSFSLVETIIYIIILPLCVYMASSIFVNAYTITKNISERISVYADMNMIIPLIHEDFSTCYTLDIQEDKFIMKNQDGEITYSIEQKSVFRNGKRLGYIEKLDIKDISTSNNKNPLYEVILYSKINQSEYKISTKVSMPIGR